MKLDTTSSAARLRRLLSAGAFALGLTTQAATVYTNQTAFEAALGGVPGYLNAFDDLDAYCPGAAVPAPRTYSSGGLSYRVTASPGTDLFALCGAVGAALPGDSLLVNVTSANVRSLGANLYLTDESGNRVAGTIQANLSDGTRFTFACAASGPLPFAGFVSPGVLLTSLAVPPTAAGTYPTMDNLRVTTGPNPPLVVTNTADSGPGSLRDAITTANSQPGADIITFNIPGGGVQTIAPLSGLPGLTGPVVIDGYSQPGTSPNTLTNGDNAVLLIRLSGTNAGAADGLYLAASNIVVRGLSVVNWQRRGVAIQSPGYDRIEGNFIGVNPDGVTLGSNVWNAVEISGAPNNTIGGTNPASRNILSGSGRGVNIGNAGATGNVISGNFVGTDKTGTLPVSNGDFGIAVTAAADNLIVGNVISGNRSGISLWQVAATRNRIEGNFIGTDVTGTQILSNAWWGVVLDNAATNTIGGVTPAARNVISGNGLNGISIGNPTGVGNLVLGNFVGTDVTGMNAIPNGQGINIGGTNNVIGGTLPAARNLISGNRGSGITVGASWSVVSGNYIGTDAAGTSILGNLGDGMTIFGSAKNSQIGGSEPGAGNVISGNGGNGIAVYAGSSGNVIQGNLIGTDANGLNALKNTYCGIALAAVSNTVGGTNPAARNILSGNGWSGARIEASSNLVVGNYIGTDITGTNALGNQSDGVTITGGGTNSNVGSVVAGAGNVISGNKGNGIAVWGGSGGNLIQGNCIGTDASGFNALKNTYCGIALAAVSNTVGGTNPAARNILSGNGWSGARIEASSNLVMGNYIGTDISGTNALGNESDGVVITGGGTNSQVGGTALGAGNLISGNKGSGIAVWGGTSGNVIQGNWVGVDATGLRALGNTYSGMSFTGGRNIVGGLTAGARNVSSGNGLGGIQLNHLECSNNIVQGNFIGADITGTNAIGNHEDGILLWEGINNVIGGGEPGAGNVIVGNHRYGMVVYLNARGTKIQGNAFGTDLSGIVPLGNWGRGLYVSDAHQSLIGGTAPGEANRVAYNGGIGIQIGPGTNNAIRANAIYLNSGLGIDLGGDGVTPNDIGDPDIGANQLQNYPVLSSATLAGSLTIQGTLNSLANKVFQLDFFASDAADPSGYGEGQNYLGSRAVTTDTSGNATFSHATGVAVPLGKWITATATDPVGNTSEFSRALSVAAPPQFTADSLRVTNGVFSAQLAGLATGARVVIEASEDLQAWSAISTNTSVRGVVNYTDPAATNFRHRFYRALLLP